VVCLFFVEEGFEAQEMDPKLIESYTKFISFYNPFLANWKKAIITTMLVESPPPQPELTDPSQIRPSSAQPPEPSRQEMNDYIKKLKDKEGKPFPPIVSPLPNTIDQASFSKIQELIVTNASDPKPYVNALDWMNKNLSKSQAGLGPALKGESVINEGFIVEEFDDSMCKVISECNKAEKDKEKQEFTKNQNKLQATLDKFNINNNLQQLNEQNKQLVEKSKKIQDQAQSGDLANQVNIPDKGPSNRGAGVPPPLPFSLPSGANALKDLQNFNPLKYMEYEANYAPWMSLKRSMDQINGSLR